MTTDLKGKFRGLILDMDGVLYRGNQALEGAHELFPALRAANLSFILLTNNATLTVDEFGKKLRRMGIEVAPEAILNSSLATAIYLQQHYPQGGRVLAVGSSSLTRALTASGEFREATDDADFVVAGLDIEFTYDKLRRACRAIREGAVFVATNLDASLPVEGGELWPGAGSIVAAVSTGSGAEPLVIGKPERHMADIALQRLGLQASEVLCVGDRLETDIEFGKRAGMPTALLFTGVTTPEMLAGSALQPDYVFDDLPALMRALGID